MMEKEKREKRRDTTNKTNKEDFFLLGGQDGEGNKFEVVGNRTLQVS